MSCLFVVFGQVVLFSFVLAGGFSILSILTHYLYILQFPPICGLPLNFVQSEEIWGCQEIQARGWHSFGPAWVFFLPLSPASRTVTSLSLGRSDIDSCHQIAEMAFFKQNIKNHHLRIKLPFNLYK